jgi:hypothetical protein
MTSWAELKQCDMTVMNRPLNRLPTIYSDYVKHTAQLAEQNITPAEYIRKNILCDLPYILTLNRFPYYVVGCGHYVFWMTEKLSMSAVKKIISSSIMRSQDDIVIFENSAAAKSIPEIAHYQVFIRDL